MAKMPEKEILNFGTNQSSIIKGFTILTDFKIHELDSIYSDCHSLLHMTLYLNAPNSTKAIGFENNTQQHDQKHDERNKHKWEQHKSSTFIEIINASKLQDLNTTIESMGSEATQYNINEITYKLCDLFNEFADKTFQRTKINTKY